MSALAKPNRNQCLLGTGRQDAANGKIKHVIYLQFDNTHFNRDNPNVASDLEQMPHLLNFLKDNGTLFTNDHTILISHTAGGILARASRASIRIGTGRRSRTATTTTRRSKIAAVHELASSTGPTRSTPTNDPLPNMITDGQDDARAVGTLHPGRL